MNMEPWAQRIQSRMAELDKKQTDLARACGIKDSSISGWFGKASRPTRMISGDNLIAVARYLRTSPEWIITGKGSQEPVSPSRSQTERLDPDIVQGVARAMQDVYAALHITVGVQDAVVVFAELYDRVSASGITTADVVWLTKRVEQGAGNAGRGNLSNG